MSTDADMLTVQAPAPAAPPTWRAMRRAVRRVAHEAREQTKADPEQPGQPLLVAIAAAFTAVEVDATEQARGARATHRRLLAAGVPTPDAAQPDAPLEGALFDIWAAAIVRTTDLWREIETLYAAPENEAVH